MLFCRTVRDFSGSSAGVAGYECSFGGFSFNRRPYSRDVRPCIAFGGGDESTGGHDPLRRFDIFFFHLALALLPLGPSSPVVSIGELVGRPTPHASDMRSVVMDL